LYTEPSLSFRVRASIRLQNETSLDTVITFLKRTQNSEWVGKIIQNNREPEWSNVDMEVTLKR